jgi:hypothetical protein
MSSDHIVSDVNHHGKILCNDLYKKKKLTYDECLMVHKALDYDEEERNEGYMYLLRIFLNKPWLDNLFLYDYDDFIKYKRELYRNVKPAQASYLIYIEEELQRKKNG